MLKPVLIGFLLGVALVGANRLIADAQGGTRLTSAHALVQGRGAAFNHVSIPADCGGWLRRTLA